MDSLIHTPPQEKAAGLRMAETGCRVNFSVGANGLDDRRIMPKRARIVPCLPFGLSFVRGQSLKETGLHHDILFCITNNG
ncbi:hypothetical protein [Mesorhizobium sp.]|uniref:hypothetical protein n=1 Tax=Mesorhizobium sp. TaxID=1871066 RepID=UPI000FE8C8BA|nr:hypothetical protein [Mesorhizobium sp.]RWO20179.1 MAG: hypothetical protein EOS09_28305 [Mesorhizobium sp.]